MKPLNLIFCAVCASLLFCFGANSPLCAADERPNFLWLTFEDTSADELGCYGNPDVSTPVMDQLANEGVRFTNAWSTAPHCSVSRSTLITGCYATTYNMDTHRYKYPQPKDIPLYPRFLRDAGYYCSNNYKTDYNIKDWDPEIWDECGDKKNHIGSYLNRKPGQPFFAVFNSMQTHMSRLTSVTTEGRRDFSKEGLDPAMLRLPPHVPDRERIRSDLAFHLEGVQDIDTWIKRHLDILEENGLSEDTIILVFSDHGGGLPRGKR